MSLHIDLNEREELSAEIYRQIRSAIVGGRLRPGDRLPPSRELADAQSVARATVVTAYEKLIAEGFAESRRGAGTFVRSWTAPDAASRQDILQGGPLRPRALWDGIPLPTAFDGEARYDFRTGLPDAALFPHVLWRKLIAQALRAGELQPEGKYGAPAGHIRLREAIARHVGISRGISVSAEDVVVTNGTQQAIDLLARVLLSPGAGVAVEDPGYEAPRRAFEAAGARVVGIPVDGEGIVVDAIPGDIRAVYVTPSHQYPLTVPMSVSRRRELLRWADRHGAAIIEDDYDGEFRFGGRPLEPLQTLDIHQRVIYVGSFSKTMLPAIRLGFVLTPPGLREAVQKAKYVSDWHSATLEQTALSTFIESGGFDRHVRKLSTIYRSRHQLVSEIVTRDFAGELQLISSTTGLHLAALATSATIEQIGQVATRAAQLGVRLHKLSSFAAGLPPQAGLVFGFGAISEVDIEPGLDLLRQAFDQA